MIDFSCPVCGVDTVLAYGPKQSPILFVGDRPGKDEILNGKPFVGATGGVLRTELSRNKIDVNRIRMTNLWQHEAGDKDTPNLNNLCLEEGAKQVLRESINKRIILLIGSATVKYFANLSVEGYNGLVVPCHYFPHAITIACVQPATVFHGTIGEFRFAIQQFVEVARRELKDE